MAITVEEFIEFDALPIRYILEWVLPDGSRRLFELSWCGSVQVSTPMLAQAQWAIRGAPTVQYTKTRGETIVARGDTGYETRAAPRATGEIDLITANERIAELKRFVESFAEAAAKTRTWDQQRENADRLFFHAYYEALSWEVLKADLQFGASMSENLGDFSWTLTVQTLRPVGTKPPLPPSPVAPSQRIRVPAAPYATPSGTNPSPGISDEDAQPGTLPEAVSRAAAASVIVAAKTGLGSVRRVANLMANQEAFFREENLPAESLLSTLYIARTAVYDLNALVDSDLVSGAGLNDVIDLVGTLVDLEFEVEAALAQIRVEARPDEELRTTPAAPTFYETPALPTPLGSAVLFAGESLWAFAERVLGDGSRWADIARENGIEDPWEIGLDGAPLALEGARLRVPADTGGSVEITGPDLLGTSWAIVDGDLVLDGTGLRRIGGAALVEQALVERGSNERAPGAAFPEWGTIPVVGDAYQGADVIRFAVDLRDQLLRDSRVREVRTLRVIREEDTIAVAGTAVSIYGVDLNFSVPFGATP